MILQIFRGVVLALSISLTASCTTTKSLKLPTKKFSLPHLEAEATQQVVEVVFKDGKTQRAVISIINQQYWRIVSEELFEMKDINKLKIKDKDGNILHEISSDSLANIVVIFKIAEKSVAKIGDIF